MKKIWHERAAIRLTNGTTEVVLLTGGGHIAHFGLSGSDCRRAVNTLWQAPWPTADPDDARASVLAATMGTPPVGRFLASFTGHALCLDRFGMPSVAEALQGVSLHGEAATSTWNASNEDDCNAILSVDLPHAQLHVQRVFRLGNEAGVLFVDESVVNLVGRARNLHWVQHATFGPPFATAGETRFSASACSGRTSPDAYEDRAFLELDREFVWPRVRTVDGAIVDLREPFTTPGFGFVVAALQDEQRSIGFLAAVNRKLRIAVGYCFRRADFPWLTIWEENQARQEEPWRGRAIVRGMEFGTTPFPSKGDAVEEPESLLEQKTARAVAAYERSHAPWILFTSPLPEGWCEIEDILVDDGALILVQGDLHYAVPATGAGSFLATEAMDPIIRRSA